MERDLVELIKDFIQDNRYDSIYVDRYDTLINFLLNSSGLTYDNKELRQDDYDVMKIVKVLEPEKYYKKLEGLKKEKQNNE